MSFKKKVFICVGYFCKSIGRTFKLIKTVVRMFMKILIKKVMCLVRIFVLSLLGLLLGFRVWISFC